MVVHDAICECFEGAMLEACLLKPCFHVAGGRRQRGAAGGLRRGAPLQPRGAGHVERRRLDYTELYYHIVY